MTSKTTSAIISGRSRWSRKYNKHLTMISTILKKRISFSARVTKLKGLQGLVSNSSPKRLIVYSRVGSTSQTCCGSGNSWSCKTNNNWAMNNSYSPSATRPTWTDRPLALPTNKPSLSSATKTMCSKANTRLRNTNNTLTLSKTLTTPMSSRRSLVS